jgi:hypothetical protein
VWLVGAPDQPHPSITFFAVLTQLFMLEAHGFVKAPDHNAVQSG